MQNGGFEIDGNFFLEAQKHGNFCFLFDGFDELLASKRESVDRYIKSLSEKFPNCPIFISSRPDERFRAWNQFDEFCVEPLSRASAISLVGKLPVESVREMGGRQLVLQGSGIAAGGGGDCSGSARIVPCGVVDPSA